MALHLVTPTPGNDSDEKDEDTVADITLCAMVRVPWNPSLINMWVGIIIGNYGKSTDAINFEICAKGRPLLFWNGTYCYGTSNLVDGQTHIVTACRNSKTNTICVYVDGVKENCVEEKVSNLTLKHQLLIGHDYRTKEAGGYFKGEILKYHIYRCAFDDKQIHELAKEWATPNKLT